MPSILQIVGFVAGSLGLDDEISFLGFNHLVHHSDTC